MATDALAQPLSLGLAELTADTPRPKRSMGGTGDAAAGSPDASAAAAPGGEPDAEQAESLSFSDLLQQLEDMAQPAGARRHMHITEGVRLPDLAACGLVQRFIRTLLSPHTLPAAN